MKSASQRASITNGGPVTPTNRRSVRAPTGMGQSFGASNNRSGSPNHSFADGGGDESASSQAKIFQLEKDLERRQESYITRERAYKVRIDELEEELSTQKMSKTGWMKQDKKITELKAMQGQILNNVELVQDRTARIMQEQERDLLRAFRARLFDVQTELEKEKSKKDDGMIYFLPFCFYFSLITHSAFLHLLTGAAAWIEKSRQLEAEVEWAKEVADRLERVNQVFVFVFSALPCFFCAVRGVQVTCFDLNNLEPKSYHVCADLQRDNLPRYLSYLQTHFSFSMCSADPAAREHPAEEPVQQPRRGQKLSHQAARVCEEGQCEVGSSMFLLLFFDSLICLCVG